MFFKRNAAGPEWLIAALGNPGKKYDNTRHNIGFEALDFACEEWGIPVKKSKFEGLYGMGKIAGTNVMLLKPQTFMNLSGNSIKKAAEFYKIPADKVLVLADDVSLPPGKIRVRLSGSAGGHNGLKSIIGAIGEHFPRIKIGVGERPHPEYDLADWVLSRFSEKEKKEIQGRFPDIVKAAELIVRHQTQEAMSRYNG